MSVPSSERPSNAGLEKHGENILPHGLEDAYISHSGAKPFLTLFDSGGGGRFAPTITYLRIRACVCVYTC